MSFWKLPESILYQSQHQLLSLDCKLSLGITLLNKSLYSDILTSDLCLHERKIVLNYEILMEAFGVIVKRLINGVCKSFLCPFGHQRQHQFTRGKQRNKTNPNNQEFHRNKLDFCSNFALFIFYQIITFGKLLKCLLNLAV